MSELAIFLACSLLLLLPGIGLAAWLGLGATRLERGIHGCTLGLAAAVYLSTAMSYISLQWFIPIWSMVLLLGMVGWVRWRHADRSSIGSVMIVLLLLVAASRFAVCLSHDLPRGWDPAFHSLLARKIQLVGHAINDWKPFENATLNYPTGGHTLIVVLSNASSLPVHTVFKLLIPLLGVLSTAQIFVFARHATGSERAGLYAAVAYGFWTFFGSTSYYTWGGLPNQLGMLLLIAALSVWLDPGPHRPRFVGMSILLAAMLLVHHHVMLVSAAVIGVLLMAGAIRRDTHAMSLLVASLIAVVADLFFLVPYAARAASLQSTSVLRDGEPPLDLLTLPGLMGYGLVFAAVGGLLLTHVLRRTTVKPVVSLTLVMLLLLFMLCEFVWPLVLRSRGEPPSTAFTPSRFVTDMAYFLVIYAGAAMAWLQNHWRVNRPVMAVTCAAVALIEVPHWRELTAPPTVMPGFVDACTWVRNNTPPATLVYNTEPWAAYLTWRRTMQTPLPVSEPLLKSGVLRAYTDSILSGRIAPPEDLQIVAIVSNNREISTSRLWKNVSGTQVVRIWPRDTAIP